MSTLMQCPACGHQVSKQAIACPGCGHSINPGIFFKTANAGCYLVLIYVGILVATSVGAMIVSHFLD